MWNENEFDSTFSSPNANANKENKKVLPKHVVPVSGHQILECQHVENESSIFECGNVKFNQVCFMGIIRNVIKRANDITYLINDMTSGDINVKLQAEDGGDDIESETPAKEQQEFIENQYVRVNGIIKSLQNEKIVQAFNIRPLLSMNELTNHMLEVINTSIHYASGGSCGGGMDPNATNSLGGGGMKGGNSNNSDSNGLTGIQHEISAFIKQSKADSGSNVNELYDHFKNYPQEKIKEAVEFLSNEGHIYSTIDDEHFKSVDSE